VTIRDGKNVKTIILRRRDKSVVKWMVPESERWRRRRWWNKRYPYGEGRWRSKEGLWWHMVGRHLKEWEWRICRRKLLLEKKGNGN